MAKPVHQDRVGCGQALELIQRGHIITPGAKKVPEQDAFLVRHRTRDHADRETAFPQRHRKPVAFTVTADLHQPPSRLCSFVVRPERICALILAVGWLVSPVHAHGEDRFGRDGGADRVLPDIAAGQAVAQVQRTATTITSRGNRKPENTLKNNAATSPLPWPPSPATAACAPTSSPAVTTASGPSTPSMPPSPDALGYRRRSAPDAALSRHIWQVPRRLIARSRHGCHLRRGGRHHDPGN